MDLVCSHRQNKNICASSSKKKTGAGPIVSVDAGGECDAVQVVAAAAFDRQLLADRGDALGVEVGEHNGLLLPSLCRDLFGKPGEEWCWNRPTHHPPQRARGGGALWELFLGFSFWGSGHKKRDRFLGGGAVHQCF